MRYAHSSNLFTNVGHLPNVRAKWVQKLPAQSQTSLAAHRLSADARAESRVYCSHKHIETAWILVPDNETNNGEHSSHMQEPKNLVKCHGTCMLAIIAPSATYLWQLQWQWSWQGHSFDFWTLKISLPNEAKKKTSITLNYIFLLLWLETVKVWMKPKLPSTINSNE